MKPEIFLIPAGLLWLGVQQGILPVWAGIMVSSIGGVTFLLEAAKMFRGDFDDDVRSPTVNTTTNFTVSYHKFIQKQTWNCKNCGGPNVEQVTYQYCGKVKE